MKRILTVAAFLVLAVSAAGAQWGMGGGRGFAGRIPDLTGDQALKIAELRLKYFEETSSDRTKLAAVSSELSSFINSSNPDWKNIEQKQAETAQIRIDLMKKGLDHRKELWSLLTDKQRQTAGSWSSLGMGVCFGGQGWGRTGYGNRFNRSRPSGWGRSPGFGPGLGCGCRAIGFGRRW